MTKTIITPVQCRMARACLGWTQQDLADRADVAWNTIRNFETDSKRSDTRTVGKIAAAFEMADIQFLEGDGVRPRADWITIIEGPDANRQLLEDIYHRLSATGGGEVLIAGLTEVPEDDIDARRFLQGHIERLQAAAISERILLRNGDTNLVAPRSWYRWADSADFGDTPFQLYGERIALIEWGPPQRVVLIDHPQFAATFRNLFNSVWKLSAPVPKGGDD